MKNKMKSELVLLRTLIEADDDVKSERISPMLNTFNDIRAALTENCN
jgi:hypothetical protein